MGIQSRILDALPAGVREHPLETAISVAGVPVGVVTGLRVANSPSLDQMPGFGLTAWAVVWTIGCVCWLVGLVASEEREHGGGIVITKIPVLILGLWFVSITALTYGLAVLVFAGINGLLPSVLPLCVAGGAYIRRIDLQRRMRGDPKWTESTEP